MEIFYVLRHRTVNITLLGQAAAATIPHSKPGTGNTFDPVEPPVNSTVADGTTIRCGKWHVVDEGDTCVSICLSSEINIALFLKMNPSLGTEYIQCTPSLVKGNAYCTAPNYGWELAGEL